MGIIDKNGKRVIPQVSIDGQVLTKRLAEINPGETITYGEMSNLIGRDVRKEGHSALVCARKYLLRDYQAVFESVMGVGLKRLVDNEIAKIGSHYLRRINKMSSRGIEKLSAVDWNNLDNESKIRHNTDMSALAVQKELSSPRKLKSIEQVVITANRRLPIGETLAIFGAGKNS